MRHLVLLTTFIALLGTGCGDDGTTTDSGTTDSGSVTGDCSDPSSWYDDADSDGYGDANTSQQACDAPQGYVDNGDDCDDTNDGINPGAEELCDSLDNDCNDAIDDDPIDPVASYDDQDEDGYGDPDTEVLSCEPASGTVSNNRDCNDDDADIWPGATEICDFIDQDCDDQIDEESQGATEYHPDSDEDGFGDSNESTWACDEAPAGHTLDASDCNDDDETINPDGLETCDGVNDEDCDGTVDEANALNTTTYYVDADEDGYGDPDVSTEGCSAPSGYGLDNTDCDDNDATEYPGMAWYTDSDGDTYGNPYNSSSCQRANPSDVLTNDDCNDFDATVYPSAAELCDGQLNDCLASGIPADESDVDGDGWVECSIDSGGWDGSPISGDEDCDDGDNEEYPGVTWYADGDGDGYGTSTSQNACERANASDVANASDCNDSDNGVNPSATEVCDGSIDEDCDSSIDEGVETTYYSDSDSDGFGSPMSTTSACSVPSGYVENDDDCNDGDNTVNPSATEVCDGSTDEDCDSSIDEGLESTFYKDDDTDGYGDADITTTSCSAPSGYVSDASDCNDSDSSINPGAAEICDGTDNDCDASTSEDGMASWVNSTSGATTDITADLTPSGASLATWTQTQAGEMLLCDGTWNVTLELNRDASIRGMSGDRTAVTLDGLLAHRLVEIIKNGISVELSDLTLTQGYANDDAVGAGYYSGGGLACDGVGTTLSLSNVRIDDSYAYYGAGMAVDSCTVDMTEVEIADNYAYYYGGGAWLNGSTTTLVDSEISGNFTAYYGGGLFVTSNSREASLDMTDSLVTENEASYYYGGGLWTEGWVNPLSITCSGTASITAGFTGNISGYSGGGVELYGSEISFDSQNCDYGTSSGGDQNEGGALEVNFSIDYEPGDNATFSCDADECGNASTHYFGDYDAGTYGTSNVAYWNIFQANNTGTLNTFSPYMYMDGSCTVEHYVLSASSLSSDWEYEWWGVESYSSGTGWAWFESDPVGIAVEDGRYYALVFASECSYTHEVYYGYSYAYGTDTGLGDLSYAYIDYAHTYAGYTGGVSAFTPYSGLSWLMGSSTTEL